MDVVNIYGRFGNVEARRGQEEETQSHRGMQPQSKEGKYYVNAYELAQKSNISLIDLAFSPLKSSKYGAIIRRHFIDNSGQNNVMEMSSWISEFTGKIDLFNSIIKDIRQNHYMFHDSRGGKIDIANLTLLILN